MKKYTDEKLNELGNRFSKLQLRRYGLTFEQFLNDPDGYARAFEDWADRMPLTRSQIDLLRQVRKDLDFPVLASDDQLEATDMEMHGERLMQPMHHNSHKHSHSLPEIRHANKH